MYRLEKSFVFQAAHKLCHHDGKCARLHGHSFVGRIVCEGRMLVIRGPKIGMLLDYGEMSGLLDAIIEQYLDHWYLNETLETDSPTSEFIAKWIYDKIKKHLPMLTEVIIEETCTCRCVYRPDQKKDD
jgi:6-pyruvoyltetrahydropterin/6-carboxytetrahydropterin synthase